MRCAAQSGGGSANQARNLRPRIRAPRILISVRSALGAMAAGDLDRAR